MKTTTTELASQEVMARLHIADQGERVMFFGLIPDIVATGLVRLEMIPVNDDCTKIYRRGVLSPSAEEFGEDTLAIVRIGPFVELMFCAKSGSGVPAVVASHAEPWNTVVSLPTAATAPIVQQRRRGRLPGCVVKLGDFRAAKARNQAEIKSLKRKQDEVNAVLVRLGDDIMALGG